MRNITTWCHHMAQSCLLPSFPHCHFYLSQMIACMGCAINNPESVYYWAWKNDIQVYCPSITDGTIGSMPHSHRYAALH